MPFREYNQNQTKFAWINYRQMIGEEHPAVIISHIVDYLNTTAFEEHYGKVGNPAYNPKLMLKAVIYGYYQGYFGGRPIYNHFETDLGLRFLTNDDFPDHRTINEFRVQFKDEIAEIFAKVVLLCKHIGLIGFENLAIDSQIIKANANVFQNKNLTGVKKELERIEKQIAQFLEADIASEAQVIEQQRKMESLERRKKKLEEGLIILEEAGAEQDEKIRYNFTDPDSKIMCDKRNVKNPGYRCQKGVDDKHQVITAVKVTNQASDNGELEPMKELSKANTGSSHQHTLADCGYSDRAEYTRMKTDPDTEYYVPDRTMESSRENPYSKWNFEYVEDADVYICPHGRAVYMARILEDENGQEYYVYECENCSGCPVRDKCLKNSEEGDNANPSHNRTITIYPEDEDKKAMRKKLDSDEGKKIYQRRMATVEPTHGDMQKNRGFIQFVLRGLEKVTIEHNLLAIAHNIRKVILHGIEALKALLREARQRDAVHC